MSDKTAAFLHSLVADAFKREVDADEAVWRSLPFFAALAGLGLAVLPTIYQSLAGGTFTFVRGLAWFLFAGALLSFVSAAYWFWQVIKPRGYRYVTDETGLIGYASSLQDLYLERGASVDEADAAVLSEIRGYVSTEFAEAVAVNRANNIARGTARSQVLLLVASGFALAFLTEATILIARSLSSGVPEQQGVRRHGRDGQVERGADARNPRGSAPNDPAAAERDRVAGRNAMAIHPAEPQDGIIAETPAPGRRGTEAMPR